MSYHFVIAKFSPIYPYVFTSKIMLLPYDWDYNTRLASLSLSSGHSLPRPPGRTFLLRRNTQLASIQRIEWTQLAGYVRLGGREKRIASLGTFFPSVRTLD